MNILIFNHNTRGQGTHWRALQFARHLHMRGHTITLMCTAWDKKCRARRSDGPRFTMFETPHWAPGLDKQEGWGPLDVLFRVAHSVSGKVDLVYSFSHKPNCILPARIARFRHDCPWVSDWCDWWGGPEGLFQQFVFPSVGFKSLPKRVQMWRRFILRLDERRETRCRHSADMVTTICTALSDRAQQIGIAPQRIRVIPSGAPTDSITPMDKSKVRAELGLPADVPIFGYLANMHLDEDLLLDAFARVLTEHPKALLLVMGPPFDHPERFLTPEQIDRSIKCLGMVPFTHIPVPLAASDVLLMPLSDCHYNHGRWPNKIGDYLAAARPVLTTDVGDAPALVRDHEVGWVAEPTPEAMADTMAISIQSHAQWGDLGHRARQVAETTLSWTALTNQLSAGIRTLTGLDLD